MSITHSAFQKQKKQYSSKAKKLKKSLNISHSKALNMLVKKDGFASWESFLKNVDPLGNIDLDSDFSSQAYDEVASGNVAGRSSIFVVDEVEIKAARTFIRNQLIDIKKKSPIHVLFYVTCFIKPALVEKLDNHNSFIESIIAEFSWLNHFRLEITDIPLTWGNDDRVEKISFEAKEYLDNLTDEIYGNIEDSNINQSKKEDG